MKKIDRFYVYYLRRDDRNFPFYIGKGEGRRAKSHLRGDIGDNQHKNNTINLCKREGIKIHVEFIGVNLLESQACILETKAIAFWGRRDEGLGPLTNLTDGGEGSSGYVMPESRKLEYSIKFSGENNPFYGRKHKKESFENISWDRDFTQTNEFREMTRQRFTGRFVGDKNPSKRPEIRNKIGQTKKKISESLPIWAQDNIRSEYSKDGWKNADKIYQIWLDNNKCGAELLGKIMNYQGKSKCAIIHTRLVKLFKSGWVPMEDLAWLKHFKENKNG